MKEFLVFWFDVLKIVFIALVIVLPVRYFLFQPFIVRGDSMEPNFYNGDYILIDELSFRFHEPKRGEVIVFRPPQNSSNPYIKRIVGLPGEEIEIKNGEIIVVNEKGKVFLDESSYLPSGINTPGSVKIILGENEYFVLGDNRQFSSDSRGFGSLQREDIVGRAFLRAWPFDSFTTIAAPLY